MNRKRARQSRKARPKKTPTVEVTPGRRMLGLIEALFPKNRTIVTHDGNACMALLRERYQLKINAFPTGKEYDTWPIPPEWNVRRAVLREGSRIIASYDESPLFLAPYSTAFSGVVSREELLQHTFSNPEKPDAFCYEFRLAYNYERRLREWRISLPHERVETLGAGPFNVEIDVAVKPGRMLVGEAIHPGRSGSWFTFLAHYCHVGQANDGLAGVAIMLEVMHQLRHRYPKPRHGYKALVLPETIGSSVYAATRGKELDMTLGAVFSEMGGAVAPLQLVLSRRGDTYVDRIFLHVLRQKGRLPRRLIPFRGGWGNDELVFDSPGVGVPAVSLDRYPFPAYHTHHDNLRLVSAERLEEVVEILTAVVDTLERDYVPHPRNRVPVYLTRYGLYADWTHARQQYDVNALVLDGMWSGLSVLDIALTNDLDPEMVRQYLDRLAALKLIDTVSITPDYARTVRFLPSFVGS